MISGFPFSPQALVKEQTPFVCRTFSKAQKHGVNIHAFGSESAIVTGPNGKTKNVIAVYQIDKGSNTPRLITNYLEGK